MSKARSGSRPSGGTGSSSVPRDPRLWRRTVPVGYGIGFVSFATIAAPLLAGFSLTAIITLSSSADHRGTRGDIAIAAFSIAAVLMLFTLQAGLAASQRSIPPDQRASQYPEARLSLGWMQQVRLDQWRDEKLAWQLFKRSRWTYNLGIIAFIGGLIALQIPSPGQWDDPHTGSLFRVVALIVVVGAILIEIALTFHMPPFVSSWLVPGLADTQRATPEDVPEMDPIELEDAQRLAFGDSGLVSGHGSNAGDATTVIVAITSALDSLTTRLADLSRAVEKSVNATIRQAEIAEAQLTLARQESERTLVADAARRRANIEVTGPYEREKGMGDFGHSSEPAEERWKVFNRGPAIARRARLEILPPTARRKGQELRLLGRTTGPPPVELGDLKVGVATAVRVSKADREIYPVNIVLSWTDDDGSHEERRSIEYTQLPWF